MCVWWFSSVVFFFFFLFFFVISNNCCFLFLYVCRWFSSDGFFFLSQSEKWNQKGNIIVFLLFIFIFICVSGLARLVLFFVVMKNIMLETLLFFLSIFKCGWFSSDGSSFVCSIVPLVVKLQFLYKKICTLPTYLL